MRTGKKGAGVILAVLFFFLQSCEKPKSFLIGEPIPFGKTTLVVQHAELAIQRGKNVLAVFVKWTGSSSDKEKLLKPSLSTKKYFTVLDKNGKRYYFSQIMDEYSWQSLHLRKEAIHPQQLEYEKLTIGENYVITFFVPEETSGLTLVIKNPFSEKGQPGTAEVALGR